MQHGRRRSVAMNMCCMEAHYSQADCNDIFATASSKQADQERGEMDVYL